MFCVLKRTLSLANSFQNRQKPVLDPIIINFYSPGINRSVCEQLGSGSGVCLHIFVWTLAGHIDDGYHSRMGRLLYFHCVAVVGVLCLFLMVSWVGLLLWL